MQLGSRLIVIPAVTTLWLAGAVVAVGQEHQEAFPLTAAPLVVDLPTTAGGGVIWRQRFRSRSSTYIEVRVRDFTVSADAAADCRLGFRGPDERLLDSVGGGELQNTTGLARIFFADSVWLELTCSRGSPKGLHFVVDPPLAQRDVAGRVLSESFLPNWKAPTHPEVRQLRIEPLIEAVAKLHLGDGATCTCSLVGPDRVLTNFHCLAHSAQFNKTSAQESPSCSDVTAQFDFVGRAPRAALKPNCVRVLRFDPAGDYALLKIEPVPPTAGGEPRRYLRLASRTAAANDSLIVLHHPVGLPLQVSFGCGLHPQDTGADALELKHDCSTAGGSSGAPMFTRSLELLAMHHDAAFPRDMRLEDIEAALARGAVFYNKALPARMLRDRLADLLPPD